MTWSLNASGHAKDAEAEAELIDALRSGFAESGASSATITTQHHGSVNLLSEGDSQDSPSPSGT